MSRLVQGILLATFSSLCWATQYLVCRFAFGPEETEANPILVSLLHSIAASLCFLPVILCSPLRRKQCLEAITKHWKLGLLAGEIGIVGDSVLIFSSLIWTTSARASLMANASPIFTVILAAIFLKEKIQKRAVFGIMLGFIGVTLTLFSQGADCYSGNGNPKMWLGDLLALLSGFTWASYTVLGVKLNEHYDLYVATFLAFFWSCFLTIPLVPLLGGNFRLTELGIGSWICVGYTGVIAGFLAFCSWLKALTCMKSSELGAFGYVSALLTALLSLLMMHERLSLLFLTAAAISILGVWLSIGNKTAQMK